MTHPRYEHKKTWRAARREKYPERNLWHSAKSRARKKELTFTIKVSDIVIPDRCPVLGVPLNTPETLNQPRHDYGASLDRINPAKGYVPGNVIVVSWRANRIRCDATVDELGRLYRFYRRMEK